MKLFSVADAQSDIDTILDIAQKDRVLVIRGGKPSVMIIGVESYDEEDWRWASDPEFWQMIRERRRSNNGIPLEEVKARIAARERAERAANRQKTTRSRKTKSRTN